MIEHFLLQEVVFKVLCLGFKGFFSRTIHKFELLLAVMTTIHILPIDGLFLSWISIFQVHLLKVSWDCIHNT
jgi:hypothetical protein